MTNAPAHDRGAHGTNNLAGLMVTRGTDLVLTSAARRIALHHRFRRRRRWSAELDRLLTPPSPWDFSTPINWTDMTLGVPERERAGADLAAAGWCP